MLNVILQIVTTVRIELQGKDMAMINEWLNAQDQNRYKALRFQHHGLMALETSRSAWGLMSRPSSDSILAEA